MIRVLTMICTMLVATPALAGLDLTWRACNLTPGSQSNETFACGDSAAEYVLIGCFQPTEKLFSVSDADFTIDVVSKTGVLPPFWHFEAGGCDSGGIVVTHGPDQSRCQSGTTTYAWNPVFRTTYSYEPIGLDRATLRINLRGSIHYATHFDANANYFGFEIAFRMPANADCEGCSTPLVFSWETATLYTSYGSIPRTITGGGLVSPCATLNAAPDESCSTPARRSSWGMIKSMYR